MKQFRSQNSAERAHPPLQKSLTLNKRSSNFEGHQSASLFSFFSDKKRNRIPEDPEQAMALLDDQIAKIRSDLEAMRTEDKSIGVRVAKVTAAVDAVTGSTCPSTNTSLDDIQEDVDVGTKTIGGSTSSLPTCDSKRDSGFVFDPKFEMIDPQKYCIPNNLVTLNPTKKSRSTTAVDFIKNNLHEDNGEHLKATSVDRLSCYSDSALLSIPGLRYPHY